MQLEGGILDGGGIPLGEVCLDGADDIIHGAASVTSEVQQSEAQSVSSCYVHHCPCPKLPVLVYVSRLDLPNQFRRTVPPSRDVRALASLHTAWRL